MKLEQLIAMKKGDKFRYQGLPAVVLEHNHFPKENTGSIFDSPMYLTVYFEVNDAFRIVFHSMYPDPKTLTLKDYEL